jgi:hypothetical protein
VGLGFEGFRSLQVCGLVWLFLSILLVYLGEPHTFFNETFITYQKEKSILLFN